jgi:hypothetical protein
MVVVSVPATVISFFEGSYCYIIRTDFCFVELYLCPYFNYEKDVDGVCWGVGGGAEAACYSGTRVRSGYQPPASSTFLSKQTGHQQPANNTFLSQQTSTSHQPPAKRRGISPWSPQAGRRSCSFLIRMLPGLSSDRLAVMSPSISLRVCPRGWIGPLGPPGQCQNVLCTPDIIYSHIITILFRGLGLSGS